MGLLDWIGKGRTRGKSNDDHIVDQEFAPQRHGHSSMRSLAAEILLDEALARERDQRGSEPRTHASQLADFIKADHTMRPSGGSGPAPTNRDVTPNGNAIAIQSSGAWRSHASGMFETRNHLGRSAEGWHGGVEISGQDGARSIAWGAARLTGKEAASEAEKMRGAWADIPVAGEFRTRAGNPIETVWSGGWMRNHHYALNERVGKSVEGFHGGMSVSWREGNTETQWRPARETFDDAKKDARAMRLGRSKSLDKVVGRIERSWGR